MNTSIAYGQWFLNATTSGIWITQKSMVKLIALLPHTNRSVHVHNIRPGGISTLHGNMISAWLQSLHEWPHYERICSDYNQQKDFRPPVHLLQNQNC